MLHQARHILKSVFGYDEFRPLQEEIIANVLQRKDTLAIMPTGGGKSLCYQIPALLFDGLTVVVSPLISLMTDQVQQLAELGVAAVVLNSSISDREYQQGVGRIARNDAKLLFVAPETLLMNKTRALLTSQRVECFAIDEAHCISEWGHDFRPEYRQLADVRQQFPQAGCLALTATATPRVQNDIAASLNFSAGSRFVASFNRQNLRLDVVPKIDPVRQTLEFLAQFPQQSGIIYCQTRQQVDELARLLHQRGFPVASYHAGLSDEERHANQTRFIRDDIPLMVATIAFGMGINKPNIRFILHYDLPKNIESYYQQIGRAGRDGLPAHCLLLFGSADMWKIKYFINQKDEREQRIALAHLNALISFAETTECRRIPLLKYFGEEPAASECGFCDNCLTERQPLVDVTIPAQKFLSCVKRTNETFGAGHVIDVLRGSQAEKVFKFGHHQLSTYGIGLEYSKAQWFFLSRQFVQQELLTQDAQFGSLKLTPKAWEVMRGHMQVFAKLEMSPQRATAARDASPEEYNRELFELLRQQRKTLADTHNVPPYAIFPDKTLIEMATYFPQSEQSLRTIHGVGEIKYERYGQTFLSLLREHCQAHQLAERPKTVSKLNDDIPKSTKILKHHIVGDAFNAGKSVQELMGDYRVKIAMILQHLHKYLLEGRPLRQNNELLAYCALSPAQQQRVLSAFAEIGTEYLKPVFEALNEEVSYDDLHILRLHFLMQSNAS
ncbi:ATP-dependent DNA helicase recQ [Candidatus Moduliflexus flocculans]|uniref:DNA helicase RecQ n=1 Tax=Candidatus Moduliflexus flocculans TaxID=1499966 RepID=A0A081BLC8_9BACT|nr:ATP-dependent DNA helicase recQ [Candidatus Moduliflexus flocculans]